MCLHRFVSNEPAALPADLAAAHAMILAERNARQQAEALVSAASLEIERLRRLLAKARREQFGQTSERGKRLIDQLELQLAELEEAAAEDEAAAEAAAGTVVAAHLRQKPARRPLPAHLPRERVVITPPTACRCCGGHRLGRNRGRAAGCALVAISPHRRPATCGRPDRRRHL